jgi:predicted metal-dependent phosphotriesterase family hydrolase
VTLPTAMTVEGPISISDLGFILPHEHILIDTSSFIVPVQSPSEKFREDEPVGLAIKLLIEKYSLSARIPSIC